MEWLVLIHILAAIIGVGPVFFYPVLFRKRQTDEELRYSVQLSSKLDLYPKAGGTLAVLSGILLVVLGSYGSFMKLWLFGSLVLYVVIQVIVIGMIAPRIKKLQAALTEKGNQEGIRDRLHLDIRKYFIMACALGLVLFIMMIAKPDL